MGATKLPKTRLVLRNFFHYLLTHPNLAKHSNWLTLATRKAVKGAAEKTVPNILSVWKHHFGIRLIFGQEYEGGSEDKSKSMINKDDTIVNKIVKLFEEWKEVEHLSRRPDRQGQFNRKAAEFESKLDTPFNILKKDGEMILCGAGIRDWEEEVLHLRNQLSPSQVGSCASFDERQWLRDERRRKDRESLEAARAKLLGDKKEQKAAREIEQEASESFEALEQNVGMRNKDDNDNFEGPKERTRKIDIMGPLSKTADAIGLSFRARTAIAASVVNALNIDILDTNINHNSALRKARQERVRIAQKVKEDFNCPDCVSVHWDGKVLILKGKIKTNRVAVSVTGVNTERVRKLLGVPDCQGHSGKDESEVVKDVLISWDIRDQVVNLEFDTTASNSSGVVGACCHLELWLDKPILWTACRHHIMELHIGVVAGVVWGSSTEPGVPLFRRLAKEWHNMKIDYANLELFDFMSVPKWMANQAMQVLEWAQEHLRKGTWPREDYKELLQLVIVCLRGKVEDFKFRLPGADHHARWMWKAIYYVKIWLLSRVFTMSEENKERVRRMTNFIIILYAKAWFQSPLASSSARHDLDFHCNVLRWREVEPVAAFKLLKGLRRHQWYTTPQMVTLALADTGLEDAEREELAKKIHTMPRDDIQTGRPEFNVLEWQEENLVWPKLASLVTLDSWLVFQLLRISGMQVRAIILSILVSNTF